MKPLKIISLPVDDGGCGWYRTRQPFQMINSHTESDTHIIDKEKDNMVAVSKALEVADIIVMRPGAEVGMGKLKQAVNIKAKFVMDIDDNTEIISPYNYHYKEHGTKEYFDKNINKWLWKDGVSGFDLKANIKKINSLVEEGLKKVDLITTTTDKLAEHAMKYNNNVRVLPNCINFNSWWKPNFKPNKKLRVGWSGGISHYEDFYSIKNRFNKAFKEFKFDFVIAGNGFKGVFEKSLQDNVEEHGWLPFLGHSYRMMCLNLDLAIVPLADLPFNHYKSPIKYLEMSAMGVPSIVPNILPYKEVIDNTRAFIYNDEKEFYKALKTALTSPHLRKKIGENARIWTYKNMNAKTNVDKWINAYSSIL